MELQPEKTTDRTSTKPSPKRRLAGIAFVLAVLLTLALVAIIQENKLRATLSDGTIVKIVKVEVAKDPTYDFKNILQRMKIWIHKEKWGQFIFETLQVNPPNGMGDFKVMSEGKENFCIWYTLSNPKRGFCPEMTEDILGQNGSGLGGSGGYAITRKQACLVDEDGCVYSSGNLITHYWRDGSTVEVAHSISFEGFNNSAKKQKLVINFPGETQPVTFFLKNPSPQKRSPAASSAASLPIRQPLQGVSMVLDGLVRRNDEYYFPWIPKFHFEREGVCVDKDYTIMKYSLEDSQGGAGGSVCGQAAEWLFKGIARFSYLKTINAEARVLLEKLHLPSTGESSPIILPDGAKKYIQTGYLVGPGAYMLDADNITVEDVKGFERLREIYGQASSKRPNYTKSFYSGSYWGGEKGKSFYWDQMIFGKTTPYMILLTDKPALLLRAVPENPEHSVLWVVNPTLKWNFHEENFSSGRWSVMPLDWKATDGPQSMQLGYAEAMPFEFHILPSDEMRRSVLESPEDKTKK